VKNENNVIALQCRFRCGKFDGVWQITKFIFCFTVVRVAKLVERLVALSCVFVSLPRIVRPKCIAVLLIIRRLASLLVLFVAFRGRHSHIFPYFWISRPLFSALPHYQCPRSCGGAFVCVGAWATPVSVGWRCRPFSVYQSRAMSASHPVTSNTRQLRHTSPSSSVRRCTAKSTLPPPRYCDYNHMRP